MKTYAWNEEKNQQLKTERGISFEEVLVHIAAGDLLDIVEHPNPEKYKGQRIFSSKCVIMCGLSHSWSQKTRYF